MDLFDLVQSNQIHRAEVSANQAASKVIGVEARIAELENRFNRLSLITHSLWELLKNRHGYTEDELRDWVNLTDLKDGRLDGRVHLNKPPLNCHKCNRVIARAFARCMYCGELAAAGDAFDRVH